MTHSTSFIQNDDSPKRIQDLKSLGYLLQFTRPWLAWFVLGFGCLFASTLAAIFASKALGMLIEKGFSANNRDVAMFYTMSIIALELGSVLCAYTGRRILAWASAQAIFSIRSSLFRHIQELPMQYYDSQPLGRTVTRMTHDVEGLEEFFSSSMSKFATAFLLVAASVAAMLWEDLIFGLLVIGAMLPALWLTNRSRKPIRELNREMSRRNSAINARLAEYLSGISVIRTFALETWTKHMFDKAVQVYLDTSIALNRLYAWNRPVVSLLCMLPLCILLAYGGQQVLAGMMSLGLLVTFIRYSERFSRPIIEVFREVHIIQAAFTSAERIASFLQAPKESDLYAGDGVHHPTTLQGEIVYRDVTMKYEKGNVVLDTLSFSIKPGEKIGFAGATGSGKTTTLSLLARLYPYQTGEILIDGRPITDYQRNALRAQLGFVSQDVIIFKGSLRENLALGAALSDNDLLDAAQHTGLATIMTNRNIGLNDRILEHGSNLSVGERQLLALTRVLLKNPSILILDEATANIDREMERMIERAVGVVMAGRTCLLIAHRLATLQSCDRILVFKSGKIVESGSHHQLSAQKTSYYSQLLQEDCNTSAP